MFKFNLLLLTVALSTSMTVVGVEITDGSVSSIQNRDGLIYKCVEGKMEHMPEAVFSKQPVMTLPVVDHHIEYVLNDSGFPIPESIGSIERDIPFNYIADLSQSSLYLEALIREGWRINYYKATQTEISIALTDDSTDTLVRLLIYPNMLKIYSKTLYS